LNGIDQPMGNYPLGYQLSGYPRQQPENVRQCIADKINKCRPQIIELPTINGFSILN
jgi:hypothetical protein